MERSLLTLIFIFLEIVGSLSQDQFVPTTSTPSTELVLPPPPPSLPPPPPPPIPPPPPSPPPPSPPPPPSSSPPPPRSPPPQRSPPRAPRRPEFPHGVSSTTGKPSTDSTVPPPRHHRWPPHRNGRQPGGQYDGNHHNKKTPRKINLGKKIGILFAGIVGILQVAVVVFLVLKKRQISKIKDRHDI